MATRSIVDEINDLVKHRQSGEITVEEFNEGKKKLFDQRTGEVTAKQEEKQAEMSPEEQQKAKAQADAAKAMLGALLKNYPNMPHEMRYQSIIKLEAFGAKAAAKKPELRTLVGIAAGLSLVEKDRIIMNFCDPTGARRTSTKLSRDEDTYSVYEKGEREIITEPNQCAKIKLAKKGMAAKEPTTIIQLFRKAVERFPDGQAYRKEYPDKDGNMQWEITTWSEYLAKAKAVAKGCIALGLKAHESTSIIGFNSPEWFLAQMGTMCAGGIAAGIYATNKAAATAYIASHSKSRIVFAENNVHAQKFVKEQENLPTVTHVVVMQEEATVTSDKFKVIGWAEFLDGGKAVEDAEVDGRMDALKPGHCMCLVYTSGTTGNPKAVMVSHDNVSFMIDSAFSGNGGPITPDGPARIVSYLPLSHVAGQLIDIYTPMWVSATRSHGATTWFARPDALKGSLGITLNMCKPTFFFGVPRVWEKFMEKIIAVGKANPKSPIEQMVVNWACGIGRRYHGSFQTSGEKMLPIEFLIARKLVFQKLKAKLGLDKCHLFWTGAAPVHRRVLDFWAGFDINIYEVYGMSEVAGASTSNRTYHYQIGSVGPRVPGVDTKIEHDANRDKPGQGEICMRGRSVMMGYMYNEKKTRETIDPDGWLHSGDVGREENGCIYITGRIKELIIGAGGENIAPVPIEQYIKRVAPALSNAMMVGNFQKFMCMIVTLKVTVDENFLPTNVLAAEAAAVSEDSKTIEDAQKDPKWAAYIQKAFDTYNNDENACASRAQKLQNFAICPREFHPFSGELGPTLKLKRPVVSKMYVDVIRNLYGKAYVVPDRDM